MIFVEAWSQFGSQVLEVTGRTQARGRSLSSWALAFHEKTQVRLQQSILEGRASSWGLRPTNVDLLPDNQESIVVAPTAYVLLV